MSTLQEHLEDAYEIDVESQISMAEGHAPGRGVEAPQRFVIDDEDKAQWALRKLGRLEAENTADTEQASREIERITQWLDDRKASRTRTIGFFTALLREFHEGERAKDPTKKTIKLPAGTLKSVATNPRAEIGDLGAFIDWAKKNRPEFVVTKETDQVDKAKVNEAVAKDGEVLPHVTIVDASVNYSVEVAK